MNHISIADLKLSSVFRFGYLALAAIFVPLMLLCGIIGLFGGTAVYQNGQPVYGVTALVTASVLGAVIPAVLAVPLTLGTVILRLAKGRAPLLKTRHSSSEAI